MGDNRNLRCGTRLQGGQVYSEYCSVTGFRLHRKITAVFGNDAIRRRQAQAGAAEFGSEVWVEDTRQDIGGYAAPVVMNGNPHASVCARSVFEDHVFRANLDDSAFRH